MVEDRGSCSLAELLCALSFATDMSMGQLMEHGLKTGYIGLQIADTLHLPEEDRQGIFYGTLLKDAGCTACATTFSTFFAGDDLEARSDCILLDHDSMKEIGRASCRERCRSGLQRYEEQRRRRR